MASIFQGDLAQIEKTNHFTFEFLERLSRVEILRVAADPYMHLFPVVRSPCQITGSEIGVQKTVKSRLTARKSISIITVG